MTAVSEREANIELLDDLRTNSIDLYATLRTIYTQKRAADIRNGAPSSNPENYDGIFKEDELEEPEPPVPGPGADGSGGLSAESSTRIRLPKLPTIWRPMAGPRQPVSRHRPGSP